MKKISLKQSISINYFRHLVNMCSSNVTIDCTTVFNDFFFDSTVQTSLTEASIIQSLNYRMVFRITEKNKEG